MLWGVIKTVAMWFVLNVKCFKIVNMFCSRDGNVPLHCLIMEEGGKNRGWDWSFRRKMNVKKNVSFEGILRGFTMAFLEGYMC